MDLYTACATFGFACAIYAIARALNLLCIHWEEHGDKHPILSTILAHIGVFLYFIALPASIVFDTLNNAYSRRSAKRSDRDLRDLRLLVIIAQMERDQQIKCADRYFHYSLDDPDDFDFNEFADHVYNKLGL